MTRGEVLHDTRVQRTPICCEGPSAAVKSVDVADGGATTILLDFDGERSIYEQGNGGVRLTPVIGVVSVQ